MLVELVVVFLCCLATGGDNMATALTDADNRQGFSHRDADAKSLLDEAIRRGMGGAWRGEWSWGAWREPLM